MAEEVSQQVVEGAQPEGRSGWSQEYDEQKPPVFLATGLGRTSTLLPVDGVSFACFRPQVVAEHQLMSRVLECSQTLGVLGNGIGVNKSRDCV